MPTKELNKYPYNLLERGKDQHQWRKCRKSIAYKLGIGCKDKHHFGPTFRSVSRTYKLAPVSDINSKSVKSVVLILLILNCCFTLCLTYQNSGRLFNNKSSHCSSWSICVFERLHYHHAIYCNLHEEGGPWGQTTLIPESRSHLVTNLNE